MTDSTMTDNAMTNDTAPMRIEPGDVITTPKGDWLCIHAEDGFAWCIHQIPGGAAHWSPAYVWHENGMPISLRASDGTREYWATSIRKAVRT